MSVAHRFNYVSLHPFNMCFLCVPQAGAGFWMTDHRLVRQQADALAKAQFAARRNPHDCALLYVALGKKTLLQVK